ncbi:MAG: M24 family metallopeptidase, partial [Ruthenibacterium sp.]
QPRAASKPLAEILSDCGLTAQSRIGLTGMKYFEPEYIQTEPNETFDAPAYIVNEIKKSVKSVINFSRELTGFPDGIRMQIHTAEEIAWAEAAANRTAAVVQRMFAQVKPGMAEYELPMLCNVGFDAHAMHPICNFGDRSVALGMATPGTSKLTLGDVCGFCYAVRGHLTSRVGIAATNSNTVREDLKPYIETFYKKHFEALVAWYEALHIGMSGDEMYHSAMDIIGASEFGVTLNPGHFIGTEEWSNAIAWDKSDIKIPGNALLQSDIIATGNNPVHTCICEDGVALADVSMRKRLEEQYPAVYARMQKRRSVMKECLGICLHEDVLPLSNLNGVYFPFMLNTNLVFAKK